MNNLFFFKTSYFFRYLKGCAVLLLLLCGVFNAQSGYGQCCHTSTLTVNTGYDPTTNSVMPIGSSDPKWTVTDYSLACFYATAAPPPPPTAYPAFDVSGAWTVLPGPNTYVSFINGCCYYTSGGDTTTYWMEVKRCFNTCDSAYINIDLSLLADDWVSGLNIDGILLSGPSAFPETAGDGPGTIPHIADSTILLPPGEHCINVKVGNIPFTGWNGHGLDVTGTVKAYSDAAATIPVDALVSESGMCTTYQCTEPPIVGDAVCQGDTTTLTDGEEPGGTWSSGTASVATINATTGIITGITAGTTEVTYTDMCGRTVTQLVTVHPMPVFTPSAITGGCAPDPIYLYNNAGCTGCT